MQKEWFTAKELLNIGELRNSEQGINKRARRENWLRRNRKGKQGTAYEYHISSLPPLTRRLLQPVMAEESAAYTVPQSADLPSLQEYVEQMTKQQHETLLHFLMGNGINELLELIKTKDKKDK